MTHVLAIGGAGNMGRPAVRTLLSERPGLDELTVADSDGDRAREFVAALVSDRVNARTPDITDGSAVTAALQGVSLVVITVGPTVLEACIEAGVDYVDICDDWEPTEAMLALDDRAQGGGVTAVVGFGASPGISNLLAVYAEDQLETADEVATAWFTGPGAGGSDAPAAAVQGVHMVADQVPTHRDGERVFVDPFTSGRAVRFPRFGAYDLYHVGHPEPVTLPRYLEAETVMNLGGFHPPSVTDAYRALAERLRSGDLTGEFAMAELPDLVETALASTPYDLEHLPVVVASGLLQWATTVASGSSVPVPSGPGRAGGWADRPESRWRSRQRQSSTGRCRPAYTRRKGPWPWDLLRTVRAPLRGVIPDAPGELPTSLVIRPHPS